MGGCEWVHLDSYGIWQNDTFGDKIILYIEFKGNLPVPTLPFAFRYYKNTDSGVVHGSRSGFGRVSFEKKSIAIVGFSSKIKGTRHE